MNIRAGGGEKGEELVCRQFLKKPSPGNVRSAVTSYLTGRTGCYEDPGQHTGYFDFLTHVIDVLTAIIKVTGDY